MADVPWSQSVRSTCQLTIDASGLHGNWSVAAAAAIRELNALFGSNQVNVRLTTGRSAVVEVAVTAGHYTFSVNGGNQSGTLRADILHGATRGIDYVLGTTQTRDHAYIFLPQHPRINPQLPSSREVGEPIMRVIVGHEFIHALGLGAHDPAFEGLFAEAWIANEGRIPPQDTVGPFGRTSRLPPLTLSADTIRRLKRIWP